MQLTVLFPNVIMNKTVAVVESDMKLVVDGLLGIPDHHSCGVFEVASFGFERIVGHTAYRIVAIIVASFVFGIVPIIDYCLSLLGSLVHP